MSPRPPERRAGVGGDLEFHPVQPCRPRLGLGQGIEADAEAGLVELQRQELRLHRPAPGARRRRARAAVRVGGGGEVSGAGGGGPRRRRPSGGPRRDSTARMGLGHAQALGREGLDRGAELAGHGAQGEQALLGLLELAGARSRRRRRRRPPRPGSRPPRPGRVRTAPAAAEISRACCGNPRPRRPAGCARAPASSARSPLAQPGWSGASPPRASRAAAMSAKGLLGRRPAGHAPRPGASPRPRGGPAGRVRPGAGSAPRSPRPRGAARFGAAPRPAWRAARHAVQGRGARPRLGLAAGEGVEQRPVGCGRPSRPTVSCWPCTLHQHLAELAQHSPRWSAWSLTKARERPSAETWRAQHQVLVALEGQALVVEIGPGRMAGRRGEDGGGHGLGPALAHQAGVGARAGGQAQGVEDDRLAAAGLAGQGGEARAHRQVQGLDQDDVADCPGRSAWGQDDGVLRLASTDADALGQTSLGFWAPAPASGPCWSSACRCPNTSGRRGSWPPARPRCAGASSARSPSVRSSTTRAIERFRRMRGGLVSGRSRS